MEAILDTNFIISCVKRKIDFIDELKAQGFRVVVPREVLQELKDIRLEVSPQDRMAVDIAVELLSSKKVEKTRVGGKTVDEGLIDKGKKGAYIATLDAAIRRIVPNMIGISSSGNSILVERK